MASCLNEGVLKIYMKYTKFKSLGSLALFSLMMAACNSNPSTDKIADTASMPAYTTPEPSNSATDNLGDTATAQNGVTPATGEKPRAAITTKKRKVVIEAETATKPKKVVADKDGIYTFTDVAPAFPGGQSAIENYINNQIEYPQAALDNNVEGRSGVSFVVDENGKVTDVHAIGAKIGSGLDEEAERVVASMPKWTPGTVKGKPVKTRMTLPIVFQIEE